MQQRFLLQILLLAQHVSGTIMPIIRNSRVFYRGCCLWYLVLWSWGLCVRFAGWSFKAAPHQTNNLKTTARNTTGSNHCIILLSSWWWAYWCPKHVQQAILSAIKTSVASSWHFISTLYMLHICRVINGSSLETIHSKQKLHNDCCISVLFVLVCLRPQQ